MRSISNFVCAASFLAAASAKALSDNSTVSLVSYKDGRVERSLKAKGTNCKSMANVECVVKGTNGLRCEDNMRIKRSDCKARNNKIAVPIKVRWTHCNTDTSPQTPFENLVFARWKNALLDEDALNTSPVPAGTCRSYQRSKKINYCKRGATMSLKYEGEIGDRDGSWCYAFKFVRLRKEWIPEDKKDERTCGTTAEIRCVMNGGDKDKENCAGNIIKTDTCENVDVKFQYQYCNWNADDPEERPDLKFIRKETWSKLRGEKQFPMLRTVLSPKKKCRILAVNSIISTCDDSTIAEMKVTGTVTGKGTEVCKSEAELIVVPTEKCNYQLIITEVVTDKNSKSSFIEIYSPNCANKIITDDFHLVRYVQMTNGNPSNDITSLKGMRLDQHGLLVICYSLDAINVYGEGRCNVISGENSPPDTDYFDSVAIVSESVDGSFVVSDAFGDIGKDVKGPLNSSSPRGERIATAMDPTASFNPVQWNIVDTGSVDPGAWFTIGDPYPAAGGNNPSTPPGNNVPTPPGNNVPTPPGNNAPTPPGNNAPTPTSSPLAARATDPPINPTRAPSRINPTRAPSRINPTRAPSRINPTRAPSRGNGGNGGTSIPTGGKGKSSKGKGKGKGKSPSPTAR